MWGLLRRRSRPLKKQFGHEIARRPSQGRPQARFFALDEARFGLQTHFRRRWCPSGHRPPWPHQHRYEWLWLYAAVEPATGESLCLYMPHLDGVCFEAFLGALRRAYPEEEIVLVLDQAGAHISSAVVWPQGMSPLYLPPRSPELDPAERWFRELRGATSNVAHETLAVLEQALTAALRPWWEDTRALARLVGYPWWTAATGSILTSTT